ncbi:MAG: hypothetical protein Q7U16_13490 [Agitococcus sp.]|nr:hypothetical protein [Agitococcus sp.]
MVVFSVTACATGAKKEDLALSNDKVPHAEVGRPSELDTKIVGAVTSPLSDFNLLRTDIPLVLQNAQKAPYLRPADTSCDAIATEVRLLDYAIGPDLDALAMGGTPSWLVKGSVDLGNAAVGALQRTVDGAIPFRSWIRKLSGAEKHSRAVTMALAAGVVRRAYLKGIGQSNDCHAPAAPR